MFVLVVCFLLFSKKQKSLYRAFNVPFFIIIFVWFFYAMIHDDSAYLTRIFLLLTAYVCILYLYRNDYFEKFWIWNNYWILVQAFLSTLAFVLVSAGILKPLISIDSARDYVTIHFWGLCSSKSGWNMMFRPAGFFDEPGALAAWAVYGYMFNNAFLSDKYISRYLPIFTVSTLSMAFYIQMAFFYMLSYVKKIYKLIPVLLFVSVAIHFVSKTEGSENDLYEITVGRFQYDSTKGLAGNNRFNEYQSAVNLFEQSPIIGVGCRNFDLANDVASDNPYEILAKDGIVGYFFTYLPLLLILIYNRRKEIIIATLVIFLGYQQRPFHINFLQDLYLWSFYLFVLIDRNKKNRVFI